MKSKTGTTLPALLVRLEASGAKAMYAQIYEQLRDAILAAELPPGTRLPATRVLAQDLRISRNTVLIAFEQLLAEGYLEARVGAGAWVARQLPEDLLHVVAGRDRNDIPAQRVRLSKRGEAILNTPAGPSPPLPGAQAFRPHIPALDHFPDRTWGKLLAQVWKRDGGSQLGYGLPEGHYPLRKEITTYVRAARGVHCEPDQVLIVEGSQQALDLCARLLLDPGEQAIIEDPGYLGVRAALVAAGAKLVPVPVDEEGLNVRTATRYRNARLVYLTPSHQYPLGSTMSLARRLSLLEWARQSGVWIIEDDYDSEYRYQGRPVPSLQGLDGAGRTIYVGTFSKVLAPGLRIGYVIVPAALVDLFTAGRRLSGQHAPAIEQAVLAEFLGQGHFARHLRRMRVLYQERQRILVETGRQYVSGVLDLVPRAGGMNVLARLTNGDDDVALALQARQHGIHLIPLSPYYLGKPRIRGFLLGFAPLDERAIRNGMRRLAAFLKTSTAP